MPPEMTVESLSALLGGTGAGQVDVTLKGVSHDSRRVNEGDVFVALRGDTQDGHDFVTEAVSRGAVAVICERPLPQPVPQIVVPDGRPALARAAAEVYGNPSHHLRLVGVTGTNGKTTVVHMIEAVALAAGQTTGVMGTLGTRIGEMVASGSLTTPEASDLQRQIAGMRDRGVETVLMEVSSHGLAMHRVDWLRFEMAVFTNLGHDHLDFHGTREEYFRSKERLFSPSLSGAAVIWVDDPWGRRLADTARIPVTTVGTVPEAQVRGTIALRSLSEVAVDCDFGGERFRITAPMGGGHNGANALLAAAAALRLGFSPREVAEGIASMTPVEGRLEMVATEPAAVVVDYAHTPGAITAVIRAARETTPGRVIALLGAGGDRDPSKRVEMARAAAAADMVMLTSDNPRSEDPEAILADLAAGLAGHRFSMEADRERAINTAVGWARPGDAVLILGKGHERYQEVGARRLPFDDRLSARRALVRSGGRPSEVDG